MTGIVNLGYTVYSVFIGIWDWLFAEKIMYGPSTPQGLVASFRNGIAMVNRVPNDGALANMGAFIAGFFGFGAEDPTEFMFVYRPIDIILSLITVVVVAKFVKLLWDALPFT